ncbi:hypothetical protein QAD02_017549 [Eretmocerus hayati]|uniref:Uncharacterized protein n=1 Tax=Eretmocerus hayati TaxID=131215 RepID=A0ACC2PEK4_9HYME|nr:hypothetical protein QAD02_017549 [Eretmocerus hayati]
MEKLPDKYIWPEAERVKGLQEWLKGKRIKKEKLAEKWKDIVREGLGYRDGVFIPPEEKLEILEMIGDPLNFTKIPLPLLIGPAAFGYAMWKKAPEAVRESLPHASFAQARNAFEVIVGHQPTAHETGIFRNCLYPIAVKDYWSFYKENPLDLEWADVLKAVNLAREAKDRMTPKKPSVGRANQKRSARDLDYDPTELQPMQLVDKIYNIEGEFNVGTVAAKRTLSEELLGLSVALARAFEREMSYRRQGDVAVDDAVALPPSGAPVATSSTAAATPSPQGAPVATSSTAAATPSPQGAPAATSSPVPRTSATPTSRKTPGVTQSPAKTTATPSPPGAPVATSPRAAATPSPQGAPAATSSPVPRTPATPTPRKTPTATPLPAKTTATPTSRKTPAATPSPAKTTATPTSRKTPDTTQTPDTSPGTTRNSPVANARDQTVQGSPDNKTASLAKTESFRRPNWTSQFPPGEFILAKVNRAPFWPGKVVETTTKKMSSGRKVPCLVIHFYNEDPPVYKITARANVKPISEAMNVKRDIEDSETRKEFEKALRLLRREAGTTLMERGVTV